MKKVASVLIMIFLLTGCVKLFPKYSTYENINYDSFMNKINSKENFVLLVWQTGCVHCEDFKPTLEEIIKEYDLKVYGINLRDLTSEQNSVVSNKTLTHATPTLVYFKEGKNESKIVGAQSKESVVNFLEKGKVIKEN